MSVLRLARREERVERLRARCGVGVRLVLDTLLPFFELIDFHPAAQVSDLIKAEACDFVFWLQDGPLWLALQSGRAVVASTTAAAATECQLCSPALLLSMVHQSRSGSMAEGFHDLVLGSGGTSDYDTMFELDGAFRWTAEVVAEAGVEPGRISPQSAPQLWAEPTGSPGFVILRWVRTSRCVHEAPRPALTPDSVRQLMREFKRAWAPTEAEISCSGPAVNVMMPHIADGGIDHVPCLRLPWWPDKRRFLARLRVTDFPPAAARRDICQYGVHLVPTGRPGSATELSEWRVSFSRAEEVASLHLSVQQRAPVLVVKRLKISLKESGAAPALKSYYIKTAVLWLVQDEPSDRWASVMDAVHMVLDWLELHLTAGSLPCFFWTEIDLLSGLGTDKLEDMIRTVKMMKSRAAHLLMAWCADKFLDLEWSMLEGGLEPLSERQLRLCLARLLVRQAVMLSIIFRPTAPCWFFWQMCFVSPLVRLSENRLLDWRHRRDSGAYHQQCCLLQALSVAPADLVGGVRLISLGGDMFTWEVTPLFALLTDSDLQYLLGDQAAVVTWCHQQLCRPPTARPAGLTAELDTPRGRAELLMQPELILRAFSEAVPFKAAEEHSRDEHCWEMWRQEFLLGWSYQECREELENTLSFSSEVLEARFRSRLPEMDGPTAAATTYLWRRRLQHLLSGDRLRKMYDVVTTRRTDRWQLRQFVVLDSPTTEGSPQGDERGAAGGEQWRSAQQEEESWVQEQYRSYMKQKERDEPEWVHLLQRERQEGLHRQEQEEQQWRHRQEQEEQEWNEQEQQGEPRLLLTHDEQGRQVVKKLHKELRFVMWRGGKREVSHRFTEVVPSRPPGGREGT